MKKFIKNNRIYKFCGKNPEIALSILILVFTLYLISLEKEQIDIMERQTYYTEFSTRADRIEQSKAIKRAKERCEENPESDNSGLYFVERGEIATCPEFLKSKTYRNFGTKEVSVIEKIGKKFLELLCYIKIKC
ncbi:MAG: hypothetical protein U9P90_04630 [Patescibacteria group bacterium]|nr:hypothetical protein [Patescibacteria group bacterium]